MLKIAITGNIASGKTTVEQYLLRKGFKVFDTDKIAHSILDSSTEVKSIFKEFVINNKIDRKSLGNYVFQNKDKLKELETIVHPKISQEILKIFELNKDEKFVFISIPQLFEANMQRLFDKTILVTCKTETRISRLMERNSLSYEDACIRVQQQLAEDSKVKFSDFIINNNSTKESVYCEIDKILTNIY